MNASSWTEFAGHIPLLETGLYTCTGGLWRGRASTTDWGAVACKNVQHAFSNIQERFLASTA
jgi:hypothetical protein